MQWVESDAIFFNTLISSASILGFLIGSLLGGQLIKYGRRKIIIIFNIIAMIATSMCMILDIYSIMLGRCLFGICCGTFMVAVPKYIDETCPKSELSLFGTMTNMMLSVGVTLSIILGFVLPEDGDIEGYIQDGNWRIIYGFPYIN